MNIFSWLFKKKKHDMEKFCNEKCYEEYPSDAVFKGYLVRGLARQLDNIIMSSMQPIRHPYRRTRLFFGGK